MTTAREWLDSGGWSSATGPYQERMNAALRAVLDPETVEAMATSIILRATGDYGVADWHDYARAAHAVVVARIDAALGTVTSAPGAPYESAGSVLNGAATPAVAPGVEPDPNADRRASLARDLREQVDRDPARPNVYANRATLREYLALTTDAALGTVTP